MNTPNPTGRIRIAAAIVGRGFLLGIGFGVAFALAYNLTWHWTMAKMSPRTDSEITEPSGADLVKSIVLSGVEEEKHDGTTIIIGTATNNGKSTAHGIHIQANLFNHGKYVDQYSTYLSGALAPGRSQYFKIACGCKDTPPAEHDSYKLEVLAGY